MLFFRMLALSIVPHVIFFIAATSAVTSSVSRPPGVYEEPPNDVYFKAGETVQIVCKAYGEPRPSFDWKRNEIAFNPSGNDDRIVQLSNAGTLVFNRPEDKDEGIFQCFARNDLGVSTSTKVNLRQAKLATFEPTPPTYHKPVLGRPFYLPCVPPESVPPPSVFWITKSSSGGIDVVVYDARVTMDREYRLRFSNIKREDAKNGMPYACVAMNNIMRRNSQGPLHYIQPSGATEDYMPVEYYWSDQDDRFGLRGDTFTVKCIFSGNPTPDIYWERTDNRSLPDRAQLKSFGQELEITDLQFEDAGTYECWATNSMSRERKIRNFHIRVSSRPYFLQEPKDIEAGVGTNVLLTCIAGGVPDPDINWFINGVALRDVTDLRITGGRFKNQQEDKILFENLQLTDSMVIQCNASNIHGYVFADVYLNVKSEAPTIVEPPLPQTLAAEGQPVTLTCRTTGKPDPIIIWFKNSIQITGGRFKLLSNGDLHIQSVVLADAGQFRCEAKNIFNMTSAEGLLITRRKTRIEKMPFDQEVIAGSDAKFTCSATTDPEEVKNLKIVWMKDNKPITFSDQRIIFNRQDDSLTVSGSIVRDSGTYTCVATNGLDMSEAGAMLTVKDIPEAPTKVSWEFCNKNATIHWMPGSINNSPLQYYILQYNTSFNPNQWTFGLKVDASQSRVNMSLSPYVNYTFRVIAYNKVGPSDPSLQTPRVCATKPDRPSIHTQTLRTLGHRFGKLYIEWTPVPQVMQNGPGFYYLLHILRMGSQAESQLQTIAIDDWRVRAYEMSTGMVYEPFRIMLRSINSIGEAVSAPPTIIGRSYESTPAITPTSFMLAQVGDTYADFKWDFDKREIERPKSSIQGEFKGFKIQFWEQNQRALTVREENIGPESVQNTTGNTFTARITFMLPNTNMEAQISVMNNYFIGTPTESVKFRTEPGLPGPVEYFRIINMGDTHVNLEWGSPFENRGDLEGYDIGYCTVKNLQLGEMQDKVPQIGSPYASNAYLSGLIPSTRYRIYIYARTAAGRGEGYFIETVTTEPGTPRMPRLSIANVGSHHINVTWWINAYAASGTVVFVEWRKLDGPEWLRSTEELINTWKNISDLEPGTTYEVRLKTTNGRITVASAIEEVRTEGTAVAFSLAGNTGWFIGMILAVIIIISLLIIFIVCYKQGFRFSQNDGHSYCGVGLAPKETFAGTYNSTANMADDLEHSETEPDDCTELPEHVQYNQDYENTDLKLEQQAGDYHLDDDEESESAARNQYVNEGEIRYENDYYDDEVSERGHNPYDGYDD